MPPVDALNMWPLISGANKTSPRDEWSITPFAEEYGPRALHGGDASYISEGRYKLIVGNISQAGWCGPTHPNSTDTWDSFETVLSCEKGCLFDVVEDPNEHRDMSSIMPEKVAEILEKMEWAELEWFNPNRGEASEEGCDIAKETGYWQPFLD